MITDATLAAEHSSLVTMGRASLLASEIMSANLMYPLGLFRRVGGALSLDPGTESRIIRHRSRFGRPLGAKLLRNHTDCRPDRLQTAIIFGHLPENIEPKQRPPPHS